MRLDKLELNKYEAAAQSAIEKNSDSDKYAALNNIYSHLEKVFGKWFVAATLLNVEMGINGFYHLRLNEYLEEYAGYCFCPRLQRGDDFCIKTEGARDATRRDFHCWLCKRLQSKGLADVSFARFCVFLYALQNEIKHFGDILGLTETPTDTETTALTDTAPQPLEIPQTIDTFKLRTILTALDEKGIIKRIGNGYEFVNTTQPTIRKVIELLNNILDMRRGNRQITIAPFAGLFNIERASLAAVAKRRYNVQNYNEIRTIILNSVSAFKS